MTETVFLESDNSNKDKFRSKLDSDNRNVKNIMSRFKIRTKNSCPYSIFFGLDKFGYSGRTNFCQHYTIISSFAFSKWVRQPMRMVRALAEFQLIVSFKPPFNVLFWIFINIFLNKLSSSNSTPKYGAI